MSPYLADTNVLSELRKPRPNAQMMQWWRSVQLGHIYISVVSFAEIAKGVATVSTRDPIQGHIIEEWSETLFDEFNDLGRVLPVSYEIAKLWGELHAIRMLPVMDGLLAATALVHNLTLATRNTQDYAGLGVRLVNPFATG